MGNLGFPEMLVIVVVALVLFGPGKLPEIGKSLGKGIAEFKKAFANAEADSEDKKDPQSHNSDSNSSQK